MTSTVERPAPHPVPTVGSRPAESARGGFWTSLAVELRLARRGARRAWPTSLLVVTLIALPMTLISGAAVFLDSRIPTIGEQISSQLGSADTWLMIVGGPDPSRSQESTPDSVWPNVAFHDDGTPVHPEQDPPDDLSGLVPETPLLVVSRAQATVRTPGGQGVLGLVAGDAADPLLEGRFELREGRRPVSDDEALVSPGALARLDADLGDEIVLTDPAATLTIVGVMKEAVVPDAEQTVFTAASVLPDADPLEKIWFASEWQPTAAELETLNRAGVVAYPRDLIAASPAPSVDASAAWSITAVTLIVGGFTSYLIVLLAGAGFAVSARRQQRSLAIAASVGADRGSILRITLLQGTVLGLVGGTAGAGLGVLLARPALAIADDGAVSRFWGFHVPWWGIIATVLFATIIGTASAAAPARAAVRGDVLSSLRGSRKPPTLNAGRPLWGTVLSIAGIAITGLGGVGLAVLNAADRVEYEHPLRTPFLVCIIAGPLLFQIGVILAGHWLLTLAARGAARFGLAPRLAARDAAANPSRIVPAFAAIAACVFLASFGLTAASVYFDSTGRNWLYQAPKGSVFVTIWAESESDAVVETAVDALRQTNPDSIGIVRDSLGRYSAGPESIEVDAIQPEMIQHQDCTTATGPCMSERDALLSTWSPIVVSADDLDEVLGVSVDDDTRRRFDDGGALVLETTYLDGDAIVLNRWDREELSLAQASPANPLPLPLDTKRIRAEHIRTPDPLPWPVILSPAAADAFDYETIPSMAIAAYSAPPTARTLDRLAVVAGQPWTDSGGFSYSTENGPPSAEPWLWLILGAAGVLVVGAAGVALGLARLERRPDDATLTAVGGGSGVRRRVAFWQALILVGIGSVTGTVAGVIPMWGVVLQAPNSADLLLADAPWLWLLLLAAGLPLVIAAASWLVPLGRPDLTRRTVIT